MSKRHKHNQLHLCQSCGHAADEDGAAYRHLDDRLGPLIRVECPCGAKTSLCRTMDEAWEAWAAMQKEIEARR